MTGGEARDAVLAGIGKEIAFLTSRGILQRLAAIPAFGHRRTERGRLWRRIRNARSGIVDYAPEEWTGRDLAAGESVAFSRAVASLEADGILERIKTPAGRTTHLQVTGKGRELIAAPRDAA